MGPETHLVLAVDNMTANADAHASPTEIVAELRFRRDVERVHGLGARVVGELLSEIGAERAIQHLIDRKVERYADLDPGVVHALGGDRFPRPPLTVVESADEDPAA